MAVKIVKEIEIEGFNNYTFGLGDDGELYGLYRHWEHPRDSSEPKLCWQLVPMKIDTMKQIVDAFWHLRAFL